MLFAMIFNSTGCTENFTLVSKLAIRLFAQRYFIRGSFSLFIMLFRCPPAEPIRVINQNLFFYSGLNFFFAAAILFARKSLQFLNYKININAFDVFLSKGHHKSPVNGIYC